MSILVGATSGLAGAAGQGGAGFTIDQSLRFSGAQQLNRPQPATASNRRTFTLSTWIKKATSGPSQQIFNAESSAAGSAIFGFYYVGSDETIQIYEWTGSAYALNCITNAVFRDPSAWYHYVLRVDTTQGTANDRVRLYVNGEQQTFATNTQPSPNYETNVNSASGQSIRLGQANSSVGGGQPFNGYMAEAHFIDGQSLEPTDFAEPNDDGVWIPKEYTGTFGANGWHLTFDSSQTNAGIGEDSAPILASGHTARNDFTASGFNTADINNYLNQFTATVGVFQTSKSLAFDGDTSTRCFGDGNGTFQFAPDPAIPFDSLRIFSVGGASSFFNWDGNTTAANTSSGGWRDLSSWGSGSISTSKPLTFTSSGGQRPECNAIEVTVGGVATILTSATDNDVDYFDTPTSNYATLNPLIAYSNFTNSNGNLTSSVSTVNGTVEATIGVSSGQWYWEVLCQSSLVYAVIGVSEGFVASWTSGNAFVYTGNGHTTGFTGGDGNLGGSSQTYGDTYSDGDIIGVALDMDGGTLTFYKNGVSQGIAANSDITGKTLYPIVGQSNSSAMQSSINLGQMPFIYTPPSGYSALQTNNLPEPTIKNGSDHFQAITDTGANILTAAQTAFPNGLWWIKDRTIATLANTGDPNAAHRLVDSVRGDGVRLASDSSSAETAYIAPPNDSVAWCWNAPTEFTNAAGANGASIASAGRVNAVAGFSIVTYTGTGVAGTVNHGLSDIPDWYVVKRRSPAGSDWRCFHTGLADPANEYIALNQENAVVTANNGWDFTLPTNQVFSIRTAAALNTLGDEYVAYCWHAVPGYSAFGNYTGNGSADGPFVYLGFKPAFVLLKRRNTTGWWQIRDSTRNPDNPANTELYANTDNREDGQGTRAIDLLSNGFKLRNSTNAYNVLNNVYIYCAFAENPFGGENAPPATAR